MNNTFIVGSPGAISSGMFCQSDYRLSCAEYNISHIGMSDFTGDVKGGAAFVYLINNDNNTVELIQTITNAKLSEGDKFGFSLSMNGNYVVVGAPENDGDDTNTGAAYVFQKGVENDDAFSLVNDLVSPNPALSAQFGWSVAVNSKGIIAVGAKGDRFAKGSVYLFKPNSTSWNHVYTIEPNVTQSLPNLGNAGWSVAINEE